MYLVLYDTIIGSVLKSEMLRVYNSNAIFGFGLDMH